MNTTQISSRQIPMVVSAILFISGIILEDVFRIAPYLWFLVSALLGFLLLSYAYSWTWEKQSSLILVIIICAGGLHASYQSRIKIKKDKILSFYTSQYAYYTGEVVKSNKSSKYQNVVILVRSVTGETGIYESIAHVPTLLKINNSTKQQQLQPGQMVTFQAKLVSTRKDQSEYTDFLANQGIQYLCYPLANNVQLDDQSTYSIFKTIRYDLRQKLLDKIDKLVVHPTTKAISKAILLGYKNDLDQETLTSFKNSGTMHILAVSGLHVGIIAFFLFQIVDKVLFFLPRYSIFKIVIIMVSLAIFAELSGSAPPVWRATLMTILYLIGRALSYHAHSLNLIGSAALIILLIDSQSIFNLSFQLSFTAVSGIILIYPLLEKIYSPTNRFLSYCIGIVYMGIAAQIAIFPISLFYFNQISILSPITSIIAITAAFALILFGGILLFIGGIWAPITQLITQLMDMTVSILTYGNHFLGSIKEGIISNVYLNHVEVICLLFAISIALMSYYTRSKIYLTLSMTLFIGQGFYHSFIGIQHTDCIEVVYESNSSSLQEIYIGRKAIVLNNDPNVGYQIRKQRKLHKINLLQKYE